MTTAVALVVGVLAGILLTAAVVLQLMRKRMVVAHPSRRSFEETCASIESVVPQGEGWGFPIDTWDFYETFAKKDLVPTGFVKLKVYFVCNAGLASRLLSSVSGFVGMMPCSWAVYEMQDGSVCLSKLNIGLMSKMFDGTMKTVMGQVADADDEFIPKVLGEA